MTDIEKLGYIDVEVCILSFNELNMIIFCGGYNADNPLKYIGDVTKEYNEKHNNNYISYRGIDCCFYHILFEKPKNTRKLKNGFELIENYGDVDIIYLHSGYDNDNPKKFLKERVKQIRDNNDLNNKIYFEFVREDGGYEFDLIGILGFDKLNFIDYEDFIKYENFLYNTEIDKENRIKVYQDVGEVTQRRFSKEEFQEVLKDGMNKLQEKEINEFGVPPDYVFGHETVKTLLATGKFNKYKENNKTKETMEKSKQELPQEDIKSISLLRKLTEEENKTVILNKLKELRLLMDYRDMDTKEVNELINKIKESTLETQKDIEIKVKEINDVINKVERNEEFATKFKETYSEHVKDSSMKLTLNLFIDEMIETGISLDNVYKRLFVRYSDLLEGYYIKEGEVNKENLTEILEVLTDNVDKKELVDFIYDLILEPLSGEDVDINQEDKIHAKYQGEVKPEDYPEVEEFKGIIDFEKMKKEGNVFYSSEDVDELKESLKEYDYIQDINDIKNSMKDGKINKIVTKEDMENIIAKVGKKELDSVEQDEKVRNLSFKISELLKYTNITIHKFGILGKKHKLVKISDTLHNFYIYLNMVESGEAYINNEIFDEIEEITNNYIIKKQEELILKERYNKINFRVSDMIKKINKK